MSVIILLLVFSLLIASGFLVAFLWSVRDGQFDDDYAPSRRILFDDINNKPTK
jgi:cbb3-type cytochrome oxidase maturation protein